MVDCSICLEQIDNMSHIVGDCGHKIHLTCYEQLRENELNKNIYDIKCPLCRKNIITIKNTIVNPIPSPSPRPSPRPESNFFPHPSVYPSLNEAYRIIPTPAQNRILPAVTFRPMPTIRPTPAPLA